MKFAFTTFSASIGQWKVRLCASLITLSADVSSELTCRTIYTTCYRLWRFFILMSFTSFLHLIIFKVFHQKQSNFTFCGRLMRYFDSLKRTFDSDEWNHCTNRWQIEEHFKKVIVLILLYFDDKPLGSATPHKYGWKRKLESRRDMAFDKKKQPTRKREFLKTFFENFNGGSERSR